MEHWKTKVKNQKVPRSCKHGDCVRDLETPWKGTHTEIVHVDISGRGPTQNTHKAGSEQGDGRMDDV